MSQEQKNRSTRTRAVAHPGTKVGMLRHALYRAAYARINEAMDAGYNLEAITLIESLLSDRLESRATFLAQRDRSFLALGAVITELRNLEKDEELRAIVQRDAVVWKDERNRALHEMAKLASGDTRTWDERISLLKVHAKQGIKLLRSYDKRLKQIRVTNRSQPA